MHLSAKALNMVFSSAYGGVCLLSSSMHVAHTPFLSGGDRCMQ